MLILETIFVLISVEILLNVSNRLFEIFICLFLELFLLYLFSILKLFLDKTLFFCSDLLGCFIIFTDTVFSLNLLSLFIVFLEVLLCPNFYKILLYIIKFDYSF